MGASLARTTTPSGRSPSYVIEELYSKEGNQPSFDDFCKAQRKKSILGVRAKAAQVKDRNEGILQARAAVQPVKEVAATFEVSESTVKRVATPQAVNAWRKHQVSEPISPPHPNDLKLNSDSLESFKSLLKKGSDTDSDGWPRFI